MLTEQEEKYLIYWEQNRLLEKKGFKQYLKGLSRGLMIVIAIVLLLVTGWYQRANMEANSKMSGTVFSIALVCIVVFMSWFYKNYKWEMNEQQYLELLAKKKRDRAKSPPESEKNILN